MNRAFLLGALALLPALASSCSSSGFGHVPNPPRLQVVLSEGQTLGSIAKPLGLLVNIPVTFKVTVSALDENGNVDPTFSRYVRISSKPGAVGSFTGADTSGRNLLLQNGVSAEIAVSLVNPYGTTYIVADDLGYVPVDALGAPPPKCADGIDNDGDGLVDYPADPGCAFANDDSEEGGSYGEGASGPIFFTLPRVADVRGLICDGTGSCSGNGRTPYPREQVGMFTGFSELSNTYTSDTVVTRLSQNGFFVTDLGDARAAGFNSLFAYNFSAPPRMRVCDRMKTFAGTPSEFFGFTQLSYPTWTLEEWEPAKRLCLVPTPERITPSVISDTTQLLKRTANLVRVETTPDGAQIAKVTPKFGPGDMQLVAGPTGNTYVATVDASNCDFDHNGKINSFKAGDPEGICSTACTADAECTEYSNFLARGTFRITVTDAAGTNAAVQADSSASAKFDPLAMKGKTIRSFAGAMTFFSGGAQYTIEVRCDDDIITDLSQGPFLDDFACMTDADCSTDKGLPKDFVCSPLSDPRGGKGCRHITPPGEGSTTPTLDPPPLACVFPRTLLDLNPQ